MPEPALAPAGMKGKVQHIARPWLGAASCSRIWDVLLQGINTLGLLCLPHTRALAKQHVRVVPGPAYSGCVLVWWEGGKHKEKRMRRTCTVVGSRLTHTCHYNVMQPCFLLLYGWNGFVCGLKQVCDKAGRSETSSPYPCNTLTSLDLPWYPVKMQIPVLPLHSHTKFLLHLKAQQLSETRAATRKPQKDSESLLQPSSKTWRWANLRKVDSYS